MSFTELVEELRKLSPEELEAVQRTLDEVRQSHGPEIEETPELLAAVDEGERSAKEGPMISLEELRRRMLSWKVTDSK
jgi:hypothetical protein